MGARPNFMKIAPLLTAQQRYPELIEPVLLHTGQHYDYQMSQKIFGDLQLPEPDIFLNVGSGTHAQQTAKIMVPFEEHLMENETDLILVVGDVNSTLACAVVASKLHIKIAHVEAGLRSFDREMPEEINRLVTDQLSDYLFVTEPSGRENLLNEGRPEDSIFFTGNVMIDSLINAMDKVDRSILKQHDLTPGEYIAVTLHRPSNVDNPDVLSGIFKALIDISERKKVVFPMHPRTRKNIENFGLNEVVAGNKNILITEPVGYLDFVALERDAAIILTDSGGIQEESCFMKVPCLTLRYNTERPATVDCGANRIIGIEYEKIISNAVDLLDNPPQNISIPEKWDGHAAERIVETLLDIFALKSKNNKPTTVKS
ncbi:MAG: UDP-N-acetylglucosamine 2-epimerase (non-hydrolyzing) [candidate division Zixibacteria bacterium]|nr:UDP-N-acetylglucosamine 2-epimerase (non-hydrolyzing) [candidate division Zixibacteria bacterium]